MALLLRESRPGRPGPAPRGSSPQALATPLAPPPVGFAPQAPCGAQRLHGVLASDASRVVTSGAPGSTLPGRGWPSPVSPSALLPSPPDWGPGRPRWSTCHLEETPFCKRPVTCSFQCFQVVRYCKFAPQTCVKNSFENVGFEGILLASSHWAKAPSSSVPFPFSL